MENKDNTARQNKPERTRMAPALANVVLRVSLSVSASDIADRLDGMTIGGYRISKCSLGDSPYLAVFEMERPGEMAFTPEELIEFCTKVLEKVLETKKEGENHAEPAN